MPKCCRVSFWRRDRSSEEKDTCDLRGGKWKKHWAITRWMEVSMRSPYSSTHRHQPPMLRCRPGLPPDSWRRPTPLNSAGGISHWWFPPAEWAGSQPTTSPPMTWFHDLFFLLEARTQLEIDPRNKCLSVKILYYWLHYHVVQEISRTYLSYLTEPLYPLISKFIFSPYPRHWQPPCCCLILWMWQF